jgi:hypothetical protein
MLAYLLYRRAFSRILLHDLQAIVGSRPDELYWFTTYMPEGGTQHRVPKYDPIQRRQECLPI